MVECEKNVTVTELMTKWLIACLLLCHSTILLQKRKKRRERMNRRDSGSEFRTEIKVGVDR